MQKVNVGGKARLTCPGATAYGSRGASGVIPPDATLTFEVEVLGIHLPAGSSCPRVMGQAATFTHTPLPLSGRAVSHCTRTRHCTWLRWQAMTRPTASIVAVTTRTAEP
jgi:hypothetical protein